MSIPRVGFGTDSHRFDPARPLRLGGVDVPDAPGFAGHSDGDVLLHAAIDALLAAAGLGDIGARYPDRDPQWKGADSRDLLKDSARAVASAGWRVHQLDLTYVADRPRILPLREAMASEIRACLASVSAPECLVTVKGKTSEGLGFLGRGEGAVAFAVAVLARG